MWWVGFPLQILQNYHLSETLGLHRKRNPVYWWNWSCSDPKVWQKPRKGWSPMGEKIPAEQAHFCNLWNEVHFAECHWVLPLRHGQTILELLKSTPHSWAKGRQPESCTKKCHESNTWTVITWRFCLPHCWISFWHIMVWHWNHRPKKPNQISYQKSSVSFS